MRKTKIYHKALVIGGTSGLGLALALLLEQEGCQVFVAGRKDPKKNNLTFVNLDIGSDARKLSADLDNIVAMIKPVDLLVYAAGMFQHGALDKINDSDIAIMINVGIFAPALILQKLMRTQSKLPGVILITSTSQWMPRLEEPLYAATKAGLAMLGKSISLDKKIKKTLIVGPAGMDTKMWRGKKRSGILLDPKWVASRILRLYKGGFAYKLVRILRDPPRVESVEKR
ncbi:SDR family oxidoreductase [Candidatus Wolfebacteria bacterium]|nr:SDR family oxidoreductase [Candidatus Wolfebacteria bacterium]